MGTEYEVKIWVEISVVVFGGNVLGEAELRLHRFFLVFLLP